MTTPMPHVRAASAPDRPALASVLVNAFDRDPLAIWLYPEPALRRARHLEYFSEVVADERAGVTVDTTDDLDAVAVWYAPGVPISFEVPASDGAPFVAFMARVGEERPLGPSLYLAFLGTSRAQRGSGSALLRHRLDEELGAVTLWTANSANLPFYARFGFEPCSEVEVGGARAWWLTRRAAAL